MAERSLESPQSGSGRADRRPWLTAVMLLACMASAPVALAQPPPVRDVAWMCTLPGSLRSADSADSVVAGEDGSAYVASSFVNNYLPTLFKFDPGGGLAWAKEFPTTGFDYESKRLAPDGRGGVFALTNQWFWDPSDGSSERTFSLWRFAANGTLLWKREFSAIGGGTAWLAAGTDGSVGIVYPTRNGSYAGILGIRKYDSSGSLLWVRSHGTGTLTRASGIGVDPRGSLIVMGYHLDLKKGFLLKYDRQGRIVWSTTNDLWLQYGSLAVDGFGNSFVQCSLHGQGQSVLKFDTAGNLRWSKPLSFPSGAPGWVYFYNSFTVDRAGNFHLAIGAESPANSLHERLLTGVFDPALRPLWIRPHDLSDWRQAPRGIFLAAGTTFVAGCLSEMRGGGDGFLIAYRPRLFQDDFPGAGSPAAERWQVMSGTWHVTGGRLVANAGPALTLVSSDAAARFAAGQIEVQVTLPASDTAPEASIVFAYGARSYRSLKITPGALSFTEVTPFGGRVKARVNRKTTVGVPTRVRIRLLPGGEAEAYLNGAEEPTLAATYSGAVAGRVGCGCGRTGAAYDDFALWSFPTP